MTIPGIVPRVLDFIAVAFLHAEAAAIPVPEGLLDLVEGPLDSNHHDRLTTAQPATKELDRRAGTWRRRLEFFRPRAPRQLHREGDCPGGLEFRHPIPLPIPWVELRKACAMEAP